MRKQVKVTHPLSSYYVSRVLLPDYSKSEMIEATINLRNGVIKRDGPDNVDVTAVVIKESPGRLIFVLEPTRRDLMNAHFKFDPDSKLTIRHRDNLFQSTQIVFPTDHKAPKYPIIYTSFLMKDPDYKPPIRGFDAESNEYWEHSAMTPEQYVSFFSNPLLKTIRSLEGYSEMVLDNPALPADHIHERPVTAKFLQKCEIDGKQYDQYVLLETSTYFERKLFPVEKGCILKNDLHTFECIDVSYPIFPYHPVLTIRPGGFSLPEQYRSA